MFTLLSRHASWPVRRCFSTSASDIAALDKWISVTKSLALVDTLTPTHLADLYITLPTRDGTRGQPYQPPEEGTPLGYGHHLAFFHPRNPEAALRPDGTDSDFCPPEPFTRRMWAGGTMRWNQNPGCALRAGDKALAVSTIAGVEKKGFDNGSTNPMVFVKQRIEVTAEGRSGPAVVEERSHVYLGSGGNKRLAREVRGLPKPDFSFPYKPTLTTLFRFSALTFNAHHIHLDKDYAQKSEGYPERLVHGPLTALMLLEVLQFHKPGLQLQMFDYRARNPVIVNRTSTIYGAFTSENTADMWCADGDGVVGMTGNITFSL
ncbi:hypothetical protein PAXINDRAFT_112714 [Paxillus involutus ATCC 200175]|nr:hypothetical protein PAXINDRAFT_112714 [Paxillus involutus ATCC 200175]